MNKTLTSQLLRESRKSPFASSTPSTTARSMPCSSAYPSPHRGKRSHPCTSVWHLMHHPYTAMPSCHWICHVTCHLISGDLTYSAATWHQTARRGSYNSMWHCVTMPHVGDCGARTSSLSVVVTFLILIIMWLLDSPIHFFHSNVYFNLVRTFFKNPVIRYWRNLFSVDLRLDWNRSPERPWNTSVLILFQT